MLAPSVQIENYISLIDADSSILWGGDRLSLLLLIRSPRLETDSIVRSEFIDLKETVKTIGEQLYSPHLDLMLIIDDVLGGVE